MKIIILICICKPHHITVIFPWILHMKVIDIQRGVMLKVINSL